MIWNKISNDSEAEELISIFGGFHDACVREAHLFTEHFVNKDLSMSCAGNLDTSLKFIVQRQFKNPSCIEMLFSEVVRFNYVPSPDNYDSVIEGAEIIIRGEEIHWSLDSPSESGDFNPNYDMWVTARKLEWRVRDEYLGQELHYGSDT